VVCVVRLALLGRGLVHIISKVGPYLFINAHSLMLQFTHTIFQATR